MGIICIDVDVARCNRTLEPYTLRTQAKSMIYDILYSILLNANVMSFYSSATYLFAFVVV